MLWREAYSTRVLERAGCPPVEGASLTGEELRLAGPFVIVAGFDLRSMVEREVWRRLTTAVFGAHGWYLEGVVAHGWNAQTLERLRMVTPREMHGSTYSLVDPAWEWHRLVQPDHAHRAFAAVVALGEIRLLMVGPPTGEAWERFEQEIRAEVLAGEPGAATV
jgi:hypothetical protein